jgi:hypothetical protein
MVLNVVMSELLSPPNSLNIFFIPGNFELNFRLDAHISIANKNHYLKNKIIDKIKWTAPGLRVSPVRS